MGFAALILVVEQQAVRDTLELSGVSFPVLHTHFLGTTNGPFYEEKTGKKEDLVECLGSARKNPIKIYVAVVLANYSKLFSTSTLVSKSSIYHVPCVSFATTDGRSLTTDNTLGLPEQR